MSFTRSSVVLLDMNGNIKVAIENREDIASMIIEASCQVHGLVRIYVMRASHVAFSSFRLVKKIKSIARPEKNSAKPSNRTIYVPGFG